MTFQQFSERGLDSASMTHIWICPDCGWRNFVKFFPLGGSAPIQTQCRNKECGIRISYPRHLAIQEYRLRNG